MTPLNVEYRVATCGGGGGGTGYGTRMMVSGHHGITRVLDSNSPTIARDLESVLVGQMLTVIHCNTIGIENNNALTIVPSIGSPITNWSSHEFYIRWHLHQVFEKVASLKYVQKCNGVKTEPDHKHDRCHTVIKVKYINPKGEQRKLFTLQGFTYKEPIFKAVQL